MAALSIQVPYPVFYDRDGQPLDNGNIYIGVANLDPVTNPLQVYYDDALTITASQPLITSGGYVYRNGTPTQLYVNATDFSITVNDSKNLFVYSFPEATGIISYTGADTVEYDPPFIGAVTSGYTVADKLSQTVSVKDFGAVGDGITDDTSAFNTAIAYLNTLSDPAILALDGDFVVNGSLSPITTLRKTISAYGAKINHDGGTLFTFGINGSGGIIEGLQYFCPSSPTAGTYMLALEGANQCEVRDITGRVNGFAKIGLVTFVGGYIFENVNLSTVNGVQTIIDHGTGAVSQINNLVLTALGTNRILDQTTPTNATATAIKFSDAWDTMVWSNLLLNGYLYGLDVNRTVANVNIGNARITNFYFDFCANGIRMKNTALGGTIGSWYFANGWASGMDGISIEVATGSFPQIRFVNVQALLAGKNNWKISGGAFTDISLENCVGQFANRLNATNTGTDQDDFVSFTGGIRVSNCRFGQSADGFVTSGVPNWQGRYGMVLGPNAINCIIQGTQMSGKTADCDFSYANNKLPAGNAFSSYIKDNLVYDGATRPAYATTATISAPTSNVLQTNDTPFTFDLYIYGGTFTDVNHNGTTVAVGGPVSLQIRPGDTWQITYAVAPTLRRIILP